MGSLVRYAEIRPSHHAHGGYGSLRSPGRRTSVTLSRLHRRVYTLRTPPLYATSARPSLRSEPGLRLQADDLGIGPARLNKTLAVWQPLVQAAQRLISRLRWHSDAKALAEA